MKVAGYQPGELITMLRKYRRSIAFFFLIIFGSLIVDSCSYYRKKVLYRDQVNSEDINKSLTKGKQFVLVTATETWKADNVKLTDDNSLSMDLSSIKASLLEDKLAYLKSTSKTQVKVGDEILQQLVIMHLLGNESLEAGNITLAISDIGKIEVYDADVGKSILIFAGFTLGFVVIVLTIILLTKSSCPFLYVYDGEEYQLAAETFGGAIYPGLERSDFVMLPMAQADEGFYKFKIRNELKERQYINKVRLIEARVPDNKSLGIDQNGVIHTIGPPISPSSAISDSPQDYTTEIASIDTSQFYFDDAENVNSLTLTFDKPADVKSGKLIIKAKSTLWMDYVFGEFLKLFGFYYNTFAEEQKEKTSEQLTKWSEEQHLPMTVSVYVNNEWLAVEQLQPIGPLAGARDLVVPLDLSKIESKNVKVKLTTGFYFWEVDYVGMDYSIDEPLEIKYACPAIAEFNSYIVSNNALDEDDLLYVVQNDVGDVLDLKFDPQFDSDTETMVFLEVSGYYTHIRDFKTIPDFQLLETFRTPGRFPEFSKELFDNYSEPLMARNVIQD